MITAVGTVIDDERKADPIVFLFSKCEDRWILYQYDNDEDDNDDYDGLNSKLDLNNVPKGTYIALLMRLDDWDELRSESFPQKYICTYNLPDSMPNDSDWYEQEQDVEFQIRINNSLYFTSTIPADFWGTTEERSINQKWVKLVIQ